jgi:triacylglycerol lipase
MTAPRFHGRTVGHRQARRFESLLCIPCMNHPPDRNPVVLIHGLWDTTAIFKQLTPCLEQQGWQVYSLNLTPPDGALPLDQLAEQLAAYIEHTFGPNQPVDLVGFSMGGIIGRYYLQRLGGLARVQRFVTISSPHKGTISAFFSRMPGCMQMRIGSAFLNDLNRDLHQLAAVQFTSTWTPFDVMILPAWSSVLPIGRIQWLPIGLHKWMIYDRRSLRLVVEALAEPMAAAGVPVYDSP